MKRFKTSFAIAFLLFGVCLVSVTTKNFAAEIPENISSALLEFIEDIQPFYGESYSEYTITTMEHKDITETMYRDTALDAQAGRWDAVYQYYKQNVFCIQRDFTDKQLLRADLASTQTTKQFKVNLIPTGGPPNYPAFVNSEVNFSIRGTIFYDPNTFKITSVSQPQLVYVTTKDASVRSISTSTYIASDKYSATFSATMELEYVVDAGGAGLFVVDFAPVTRSAAFSPQG